MITTNKDLPFYHFLLPDELEKCEIIEGNLVLTPAPTLFTLNIAGKLATRLFNFIWYNNLGVVFSATLDVILDKNLVVQPDIIFISKNNTAIIEEKIFGVPDLVIEILSPFVFSNYTKNKILIYQKFKVPEYWIIDPLTKSVNVFVYQKGGYKQTYYVFSNDNIKSSILPKFKIELKDCF